MPCRRPVSAIGTSRNPLSLRKISVAACERTRRDQHEFSYVARDDLPIVRAYRVVLRIMEARGVYA